MLGRSDPRDERGAGGKVGGHGHLLEVETPTVPNGRVRVKRRRGDREERTSALPERSGRRRPPSSWQRAVGKAGRTRFAPGLLHRYWNDRLVDDGGGLSVTVGPGRL